MQRAWLIGGGVFLAVLLVASIVVGLTQRTTDLPEGTPERAVQLFLRAIEEEDFKSAYSVLSEETQRECNIEHFVGAGFRPERLMKDSRVTLKNTRLLNGTAVVEARVTQIGSNEPFGASEWSHEERFTLKQESGEWRLSEYFWPRIGCTGPFPDERVRRAMAPEEQEEQPPPSPTPPAPASK